MAPHKFTKEEKEALLSRLDSLYQGIYLKVDDYLVYAVREPCSASKMEIAVYVNGKIDFKLLFDKGEVAKRFYRPVKRYIHCKKSRDFLIKVYGKRKAKKEGINDRHTMYYPTWINSKSFVSHLEKNNESIEIITHDQYETQREIQNKENV